MPIHKLLVPTDGSAFARRASELATEIAQATGSKLLAVHVIAVKPPAMLDAAHIDKLKTQQAETCFKDIEEQAKAAGVSFEAQTLVARHVPDAILEEIRNQEPDIVVMGSHGLTGIKKLLLGSVTTAVMEKSAVPVLVVK